MKITVDSIISDHDPLIRTKSEPVSLPLSSEDRELLEAMLTYVRDSQDDEKQRRKIYSRLSGSRRSKSACLKI